MNPREQDKQEIDVSKKKSNIDIFLVLSGTLFASICAASAFLFFENSSLSRAIEAGKNDITNYTIGIEKIKSDKNIIAAELVANNKSEILATIKKSEAQTYIKELQDISQKYKMMFSWFSYEHGKIATSAIAMPEKVLAWEDGMIKISNLVRDYRTGTGLLFDLSPILSVSGYEQKRAFSIEFTVK